jgi:hypothetical protein
MIKQIILLLILSLCCAPSLFAEQKVSAQDQMIGSTFKTLAKTFIATSDINVLKYDSIAKLSVMSEEKFQKRYAEVYPSLKRLPEHVKKEYAVSARMTRAQAIRDIRSLNRNKIYALIDSVPNEVIAAEFRRHLAKQGGEAPKGGISEQINRLWREATQNLRK